MTHIIMTHLKKVEKGNPSTIIYAPSDDRGARGAKASWSRKLLGRRSPGDVWIFFQGVEPLEKPLEGQMEKETGKIRDVLRSYMNLP